MQGEALPPKCPAAAEALAEGAIGLAHMDVMLKVRDRIPHKSAPEVYDVVDAWMTDNARTLGPTELEVCGREVLARVDPDGSLTDDTDRKRNRGLSDGAQGLDMMAKITGNLDPATSLDIVQLLRRIHDSGTTIVMATHDNVIVDELQKRVIELEDGHIIRDEEGGSYVPKVVDSRDRDEREAVRAHDERDHHDDGALPPQEDRPIGEVHALDEWDDDAEDLLR